MPPVKVPRAAQLYSMPRITKPSVRSSSNQVDTPATVSFVRLCMLLFLEYKTGNNPWYVATHDRIGDLDGNAYHFCVIIHILT